MAFNRVQRYAGDMTEIGRWWSIAEVINIVVVYYALHDLEFHLAEYVIAIPSYELEF